MLRGVKSEKTRRVTHDVRIILSNLNLLKRIDRISKKFRRVKHPYFYL